MSDETFHVSLGGREWRLPHLPFRAIKKIQPALFQVYAELGGPSMSAASIGQLGEAQLDRLAEATYQAIHHVDSDLSREAFLDLAFSVGELMRAFPAIAKAVGLRAAEPTDSFQADGAREAPGESISIG